MMEIIVLGSGGAFDASRNPSGYAVRLDRRRTLVFDLGFGNFRALQRARIQPGTITDVFISHRHPDHCGDLAALLFHFRYHERGPLRLWGPKGFTEFVAKLQDAHKPWCGPKNYALEVREIWKETAFVEDWSVDSLAVPHPTPALAYRLSYKGKSFVYSGDTGFHPPLADFAAEADLVLLECASSEKEAFEGHMTPRVALATLEASRCKKGALTHVTEAALADYRRVRGKKFPVARDGQKFRL